MTEVNGSVPPGMENFIVGIIGMGDMGKMYARRLSAAGWRPLNPTQQFSPSANDDLSAFGSSIALGLSDRPFWLPARSLAFHDIPIRCSREEYLEILTVCNDRIIACDREEQYEKLREEFASMNNIQILRNGHLVSRASDYIIYSVEAAAIDRVVAEYGPSTKLGAIVGGQTSCKDPEIKAFETHLPEDADIVSCHSLHGPRVDTRDQPLVIIKHRASDESLHKVETVLRCLHSKHVYLTAHEHDRITADTQAVTHAAFLSMGKAWHSMKQFPWEGARYVGGIENVKINLTMRIYSQKWHVYAGLAILNPEARKQIDQYAKSVTELYKLMLEGRLDELRARVLAAKEKVFGREDEPKWADKPLLEDAVLDQFSLGKEKEKEKEKEQEPKAEEDRKPNNHLSLLAMVDCWSALGTVPYDHMICSTPLFRLWLGVTEHLFRSPARLDEALRIAVADSTFRSDDLEFTFAARGWAECVGLGHFDTWRERFVVTQKFFEPRFPGAIEVGNAMVKAVLESTKS